MDTEFSEEGERLFRAVWDWFWKKDGTLAFSAFQDKNGLSVDREDDRPTDECIGLMKKHGLKGSAVSVTVRDCREIAAHIHDCRSTSNIYHFEIHSSVDEVMLTEDQALYLSQVAIFEGRLTSAH